MLYDLSPRRFLTDSERHTLGLIAGAALPAGTRFPAAGADAVRRAESFLARGPAPARRAYQALIRAVDVASMAGHGRRFSRLAPDRRERLLDGWRRAGLARRTALRLLVTPLKFAHFDSAEFFQAIGCVYDRIPVTDEPKPRWMSERTHSLTEVDQDLELDCDVVVIGTGAGGAVAARELAERGHAVIMLEEGRWFGRADFANRPQINHRRMYRNMGATFSVGNATIPIPLGMTVGGTTTINSGTCYRVPDRVLAAWRAEHGLVDLTPDKLAGHYERVEEVLGVAPAQAAHLGGVARVIARGCEALGYKRHNPLLRNAPDCDGQGVCCFGCPTDAKRSTNVSYVPLALRAGAELFTSARARTILIEAGRAVGVVAHAPGGRKLTVRARAVVVACGALLTPVLLQENGLCGRSGQLGRNLSIHPATACLAVFDEVIAGFTAIPQGYAIEEFHDEGILFEGAHTPLDMSMSLIPYIGRQLIDMAEAHDHVAMFGFMIEDTSRGAVRSVFGQPAVTYMMNRHDVARLKRGMEILARVFLAAGASAVYPMVHGFDRLDDETALTAFRRARLRASDFELSAYHPLGTARMGVDPSRSVVGPTHEAHDVPGLYVCDGSVMPSSLAVNPQLTIMALATRAAGEISAALSG